MPPSTPEPRIISLIASATEIVCALGLREELVGRSHECDYPEDVKSLPVCTSPKFKTDVTSSEIDKGIKKIVELGLSVYKVDPFILEKLKPTHIITQDQCEVCAVSLKDVEEAVCKTTKSNPKVISLKTDCLADLFRDIQKVADAANVSEKGIKLVQQIRAEMELLTEKGAQAAMNKGTRPRVACIEWIDPLMSAGNWMPEIIEMAGGQSVFGEKGKHSPWITWDDIIKENPDVLFISPCGFDIKRTKEEMHILEQKSEWKKLKAVTNQRVYIADGNQYFHRPGPRLLDSLEIMTEILYPEYFEQNFHGTGWIQHK